MITPSEVEDATPTIRITVEMKEAAPYEAKLEGRESSSRSRSDVQAVRLSLRR